MFSWFQSSSASVAAPVHAGRGSSSGWSGFDDVAFGCECADPSLQIDSWGQEHTEPLQAAGSPG